MQDVSDIADTLERLTDRPVLDKTQLEGKYDYDLSFTVDSAQLPSNLPSAVERQLGLKMDSKRDILDILVIDSINRDPLDN